jgi:hypothetical protein
MMKIVPFFFNVNIKLVLCSRKIANTFIHYLYIKYLTFFILKKQQLIIILKYNNNEYYIKN